MAALGDEVLFASTDTGFGPGLWKTDGTAGGTKWVSSLAGEINVAAYGFKVAAGKLFLVKTDFADHVLWQSDGTAAGTTALGRFRAAWAGDGAATAGGTFYFTGNDGPVGILNYELWKTDGTPQGTVLVADLAGGNGAAPRNITPLGEQVIFAADSTGGANGTGMPDTVWRSDGTAAGTVRLTDPSITPALMFGRPEYLDGQMGTYAGKVFFGATGGAAGGAALWATDGTPAGTLPLAPLPAGFSGPDQFATAAGLLFFRASDAQGRSWLWRTDGTAAGTVPVRQFPTPPGHPLEFAAVLGGTLYFSADGGGGIGRELWRSDGTAAGTFAVTDIYPGPVGSHPDQFTAADGALYFTAIDPEHGRELWKYTPDPDPPAVTGAWVAGTPWSSAFLDRLAVDAPGSTARGMSLPLDNAATRTAAPLPWSNLDRITLRFDRPATVAQADLRIRGATGVEYPTAEFSYDPAAATATWTLQRPIDRADRVELQLAQRVAGAGGGGWSSRLDVLPGDVNRSGAVLADDFSEVKRRFFATAADAGASGYSVFHDVNGSGAILADDFSEVKRRFFQRPPPPAAPADDVPGFATLAIAAPADDKARITAQVLD
jgi:ELWxxDGT repeat protein